MVRTRVVKDGGIRSKENTEVSGHRKIRRPKLRWSDVIRKYMKENGVERSTRTENLDNENFMCRPKIWKRLKKKHQLSTQAPCIIEHETYKHSLTM